MNSTKNAYDATESLDASILSQMEGLNLSACEEPNKVHQALFLEPSTLLLRVKIAGICRTHSGIIPEAAGISGHYAVGIVVAVAKDMTEFRPGDHVGALFFDRSFCSYDVYTHGMAGYCPQAYSSVLESDGGIAQYVVADPMWTVHLPCTMEFEKAAQLMFPGAAVYHALLRCAAPLAGPRRRDCTKCLGRLGIVGTGMLGHLAVQLAKAMGYTVVAVNAQEGAMFTCQNMPEHLRPDLILSPGEGSVDELLRGITVMVDEGMLSCTAAQEAHLEDLLALGLDAVLVCTNTTLAFVMGMELLAAHGTLVYMVQPEEPVPVHYARLIGGNVKILAGCFPFFLDSSNRLQRSGGIKTRDLVRDMMQLVEEAGCI